MLKIKLQYYNNTLCIHASGMASTKEIERLKNNIRSIIKEYKIKKIQLEIDNNCNIHFDDLEEFSSIMNYHYHNYYKQDYLYFKGLRA